MDKGIQKRTSQVKKRAYVQGQRAEQVAVETWLSVQHELRDLQHWGGPTTLVVPRSERWESTLRSAVRKDAGLAELAVFSSAEPQLRATLDDSAFLTHPSLMSAWLDAVDRPGLELGSTATPLLQQALRARVQLLASAREPVTVPDLHLIQRLVRTLRGAAHGSLETARTALLQVLSHESRSVRKAAAETLALTALATPAAQWKSGTNRAWETLLLQTLACVASMLQALLAGSHRLLAGDAHALTEALRGIPPLRPFPVERVTRPMQVCGKSVARVMAWSDGMFRTLDALLTVPASKVAGEASSASAVRLPVAWLLQAVRCTLKVDGAALLGEADTLERFLPQELLLIWPSIRRASLRLLLHALRLAPAAFRSSVPEGMESLLTVLDRSDRLPSALPIRRAVFRVLPAVLDCGFVFSEDDGLLRRMLMRLAEALALPTDEPLASGSSLLGAFAGLDEEDRKLRRTALASLTALTCCDSARLLAPELWMDVAMALKAATLDLIPPRKYAQTGLLAVCLRALPLQDSSIKKSKKSVLAATLPSVSSSAPVSSALEEEESYLAWERSTDPASSSRSAPVVPRASRFRLWLAGDAGYSESVLTAVRAALSCAPLLLAAPSFVEDLMPVLQFFSADASPALRAVARECLNLLDLLVHPLVLPIGAHRRVPAQDFVFAGSDSSIRATYVAEDVSEELDETPVPSGSHSFISSSYSKGPTPLSGGELPRTSEGNVGENRARESSEALDAAPPKVSFEISKAPDSGAFHELEPNPPVDSNSLPILEAPMNVEEGMDFEIQMMDPSSEEEGDEMD